jgi:nucleoside phosphorylase
MGNFLGRASDGAFPNFLPAQLLWDYDAAFLVLTALKSELDSDRAPDGAEVVYVGVGKISAAIATTAALLDAKPDLVVNYGTCGKIAKNLRGLLEVSRVVPRDMMAMPLARRGVTPQSDDESLFDLRLRYRRLRHG